MILGIKKNSILLLTTTTRHLVQTIPLFHVDIVEKHPTAIVLQITNIGPLFRLNTQQGFEIERLISQYKKME